jgi:thioredoxin 1
MSVFHSSVENLNKMIEVCAENGVYLVVKASAEWCAPCKLVKSKFEQLAKDLVEKAVFTSFDVDEQQAIAEQFVISAMPTFIIIKGHNIIKKITGTDLASIRNCINSQEDSMVLG